MEPYHRSCLIRHLNKVSCTSCVLQSISDTCACVCVFNTRGTVLVKDDSDKIAKMTEDKTAGPKCVERSVPL